MARFRLFALIVWIAIAGADSEGRQPQYADISGVVTTAADVPVAGLLIQAARWVPPRGDLANRELLPVGLPGRTDTQGRYRIRGILPGPVVIAALAWKFPSPSSDGVAEASGYDTTFFPGTTDPALARTVDADGSPISEVNFTVRAAASADVVVRFTPEPSASGGESGAVLAPASPLMRFGNRNVANASVRNSIHTFTRVPVGHYILTYQGEQGWARQPLEVTEAARAPERQVTLRPYLSLSGRVELNASQIQLTDVTRPALLSEMSVSLNAIPFVGGATNTTPVSPDGQFVFPRLAADTYMLLLSPNGNWRTVSGVINGQESLDKAVLIEADVRDARVVVFDRDTSIYGLVRDARNNLLSVGTVVVFSVDEAHWNDTSSRRVRSIPVGPTAQYGTLGMAPGRYLAIYFAPDEPFSLARLTAAKQTGTPFDLAMGQRVIVDVSVK
jgi:hypothetical protein